jgi:hypothetical protein
MLKKLRDSLAGLLERIARGLRGGGGPIEPL